MGDLNQYDGQEFEGFERLDEEHPALKALRAERTLNKELRQSMALQRIVAQHPNLGLTAADFEGLTTVEQFEARAERLAALAGAAQTITPAPSPSSEPEPGQQVVQPEPELSEAEKAFARMAQPLSATPPTDAKKITVQQAQHLYKTNRPEFERLRAAGQIDLGVKISERGGSLVFE